MKPGWLSCFAWICMMSLLVCLRTEFSQQRLTSVVKGRLRNVFILSTQPACLVRSLFQTHAHTCGCTRIWHIIHSSSASRFSAQLFLVTQPKHTGAHPFSPSTPVVLLPIKYEGWRQWDGAFRCGTGGVWVIFRQLCLKQWNQTEVPCRVRRLLLKVVLLLSGSAQTHSYPYPEKIPHWYKQ